MSILRSKVRIFSGKVTLFFVPVIGTFLKVSLFFNKVSLFHDKGSFPRNVRARAPALPGYGYLLGAPGATTFPVFCVPSIGISNKDDA